LKTYDVAIVGGGVVGLMLALALARLKFTIVLIERNISAEQTLKQAAGRVSAINLASQAIFESLGIWSKIKLHAGCFEQIRVFEPSQTYELCFDSTLVQAPYLGHIVEHSLMLSTLMDALSCHSVEVRYQNVIQSLNIGKEKVELTLETGEVITSRLIVGADGMHSKLRDLGGISINQRDYHQTALVAKVKTEKSHEKTAWQCFRQAGPLAFLPLKDENTCSIVWSASPSEISALEALSAKEFASALKKAFENRLGDVELQSKCVSFPLKVRYAKQFVKPRFALVGDAIHTIHPLAGQGLNLGLADAASLAKVLENARRQENDIGNYLVLRRYERWRKNHHIAAITAMDIFKQGFGVNIFPLAWMRKHFMKQFNKMDYLKRWCIYFATGLKGLGLDVKF